ncbi:unnamed protein product [Boreogadus saida]
MLLCKLTTLPVTSPRSLSCRLQFTTRVNERTNERSVSQRVVGLGGVMSPRVVFSSPLHHVSERTVSQRVVCLGGVNSESSCSLQFTTRWMNTTTWGEWPFNEEGDPHLRERRRRCRQKSMPCRHFGVKRDAGQINQRFYWRELPEMFRMGRRRPQRDRRGIQYDQRFKITNQAWRSLKKNERRKRIPAAWRTKETVATYRSQQQIQSWRRDRH